MSPRVAQQRDIDPVSRSMGVYTQTKYSSYWDSTSHCGPSAKSQAMINYGVLCQESHPEQNLCQIEHADDNQ